MPLISVHDLRFSYPSSAEPALRGVGFTVEAGEYLAVVGANGSGKSTLARCLNGLLPAPPGSVFVAGFDPSVRAEREELRKRLSLVFQSPPDQIVSSVVEEDVAFGPENLGLALPEMRKRVERALRFVGLWTERKRSPRFLSAGQQQRLAVAGALAMEPACIVFDEATAMIDPAGRAAILELLDGLVRDGCAVVHITHDMAEAARARRVLALHEGRVAYDGDSRSFFARDDLAELGLERPQAMRIASALGLTPIPDESARALALRIWDMREPSLASVPSPGDSPPSHAAAALPDPAAASAPATSPGALPDLAAAPSPTAAPSPDFVFSAEDIVFRYLEGSGDESLALNGISLALPKGASLALVGATGSGKSTLLQLFAALASPSSGALNALGKDPSAGSTDLRSLRMGSPLSVQRPESAIFELYAGDEAAFGPRNQGHTGAALVERVREALDAVGLPYDAFRDRPCRALSGGQKRRLAIASVLSMRPQALLMDEPGSALDPGSRAALMDTLFAAATGKAGFVYATHSMEEAARADYMAVLASGRLLAFGSPRELFGRLFSDAWGIARPFAAELAAELRGRGLDLPADVLGPEELCRLLLSERDAAGAAKGCSAGAAKAVSASAALSADAGQGAAV
jgi:energy-coupling factor transport system ATP-binding protein